mmetsp:Transcript_11541/g.34645  ORF Transcript_11541/g.34645 Transcript_11541/m.34645 type:complete len:373 (+) Transcript_11541:342-1460(+)|eukprot:CAMPEP_0206138106 /NCGR_PEP_ID=MMETSP1473-20131121/3073_1 /ASSEMBLY_ACC=CAM_ASM_001109 /TAXON_ID=1461547 /ORGANISM="Stichococcus sp, Strain RCC1054" /LENGTH=372 /DNA_ID=CAMNT_0053531435 /DNA_START=257 /DNA_END=1375 /DNA_ORIENTATION=-
MARHQSAALWVVIAIFAAHQPALGLNATSISQQTTGKAAAGVLSDSAASGSGNTKSSVKSSQIGDAWRTVIRQAFGAGSLGVKTTPAAPSSQTRSLLGNRCAALLPTAQQLSAAAPRLQAAQLRMEEEQAAWATAGASEARLLASYGPLVKKIKVYWHVIRTGTSYRQGNLSRGQINRQLAKLNQSFKKANIYFMLAGVDYTTNGGWFQPAPNGAIDMAMKQRLHRGSMKDFNVYSCVPLNSKGMAIAGYSELPARVTGSPYRDGSVILHTTLPGGTEPQLNLGMTLVHEAGHWLSLQHTFEGGCNFPGDSIGDTAYEAAASTSCTVKNTCPQQPGMDPIHNPMNYSPDWCMREFSTMQVRAMRKAWYAYRS